MATRRPPSHRVQPRPTTPRESFIGQLLDPIDRLSETLFSILILLTFTMAFGVFKLGGDPQEMTSAEYSTELLIAALSATFAWGLIDGVMYALFAVFERGEKHRLLKRIQDASTHEESVDAIADELDHILEPITSEQRRYLLYTDILEHLHDGHPQPVKFNRYDLAGALGCVLVAVIAVLPSLTPFVLFRNHYELALRASNLVSFGVLFYSGYQWGKYSGSNPFKTGLLMFVIGLVLVLIAILLGG